METREPRTVIDQSWVEQAVKDHEEWMHSKGLKGRQLVASDQVFSEEASRLLWSHCRDKRLESIKVVRCVCRVESDVGCPNSDFRGTVFGGTGVGGARFEGCDLRDTTWLGVDLETMTVLGSRISGYGLYGDAKSPSRNVRHADMADYSRGPRGWKHVDAIIPWSTLRGVGNMPLLGVSNSALVFIFAWGATVAAARRWIDGQQQVEASAPVQWVTQVVGPVGHNLALANLSLALIAVALASAIHRFGSPAIVKEYTEAAWTYEHRESVLEYRAAAASLPGLRWLCALLYTLGLGYILVWYVPMRAWIAYHALATN